MKVAFVIPKDDDQHGTQNQYTQGRIFPPVGLVRMAGIAGKQGRIRLIDERIEPNSSVDTPLIAIVFINSYNQQRACDLARCYQAMGCFVVMTGPILSQPIKQEYNFVDCLFIGAGEDNFPHFLADCRKGKTKRYYRHSGQKAKAAPKSCISENTYLSLAS